MKILAFVDLHGNRHALKNIIERAKKEDADAVICAGDFTIFGSGEPEMLHMLNSIGKPVLIVHGNHEDEGSLRRRCLTLKNCIFLHNNKFRINGHLFIGWGGGGFSYSDSHFEKAFGRISAWIKKDDRAILITHAPPYKTKIDRIQGQHAGSKSVRRFIEKFEPVLAVSGHLHECVGEDHIGHTKVMNPGYKGRIIYL